MNSVQIEQKSYEMPFRAFARQGLSLMDSFRQIARASDFWTRGKIAIP